MPNEKKAPPKPAGPCNVLLNNQLCCPVAAERLCGVAIPNCGECAITKLTYALACDAENRGDLLHRHWLAGLQSVVHQEDFPVARRQRAERAEERFAARLIF